jgi:hypothetical protein
MALLYMVLVAVGQMVHSVGEIVQIADTGTGESRGSEMVGNYKCLLPLWRVHEIKRRILHLAYMVYL